MVALGQSGVFGKKWLYLGKSGCIREKMVFFGKKLLYSGNSGCIRSKLLNLGKIGCIWSWWLYSEKSLDSDKCGCIQAK